MLALMAMCVWGLIGADGGADGPHLPLCLTLEESSFQPPAPRDRDDLLYLEAAARITLPGGDVVGSGGPKYSDLFGPGIGLGLQGDYLWRVSRTVSVGGYLEFDVDSFGGKTSTDSFGTSLRPDRMTTYRMLAGFKVREEFAPSRLFMEGFLALGANYYPSVNGTLSGNGMDGSGQLFSSTTKVAFDVGANFGWTVAPRVDLFLGIAAEINGGPGQGRDIVLVSMAGSSSPGTMVNFGFNLGVNIGF